MSVVELKILFLLKQLHKNVEKLTGNKLNIGTQKKTSIYDIPIYITR